VLRAKFPQCFARLDQRSRQPLKIGIHADILVAAPEIDPTNLGKALQLYTHQTGYLAQCVEGRHRIDLSGEPAGIITAAEAEHARTLLAKCKGGRQRQPQTGPAAPPAKLKLSLSDLKAAAVRRRSVGTR
jgi:ProP effector